MPPRPCTASGDDEESYDVFEIAETGTAVENLTDGATSEDVGSIGCSAMIAALEMQSVVPHACSPME
jgi:hypothetical protein